GMSRRVLGLDIPTATFGAIASLDGLRIRRRLLGPSPARLLDDPIPDGLEHLGRDGGLDPGVFARRARLAGLEEVVEAWELDRLDVPVAAGLEGLADLREVLLRRDLQVLLAVDRQDGTTDLL